jgi:hypothetical protein
MANPPFTYTLYVVYARGSAPKVPHADMKPHPLRLLFFFMVVHEPSVVDESRSKSRSSRSRSNRQCSKSPKNAGQKLGTATKAHLCVRMQMDVNAFPDRRILLAEGPS